MKNSLTIATILIILAMVIIIIAVSLPSGSGTNYTVGPLSVRSLMKTEQLKVLSVHKEILASQRRKSKGLFKDKEEKIYVIYPATLQFGFDLAKADTNSIVRHGDSVDVVLPPVTILNRDGKAVDEADKRTAIEEGTWSAAEMTLLRERAEAMMLRNCEYDSCYAKAERTARFMMASMMRNMGVEHFSVTITPRADYGTCLIDKKVKNSNPYLFCMRSDRPCLSFNTSNGGKEGLLFYDRNGFSQYQLLAVGDVFIPFMASTPREAEMAMRKGDLYVLFHNANVKADTKEAKDFVAASKKRKNAMDALQQNLSPLVADNQGRVFLVEVDKNKKYLLTY